MLLRVAHGNATQYIQEQQRPRDIGLEEKDEAQDEELVGAVHEELVGALEDAGEAKVAQLELEIERFSKVRRQGEREGRNGGARDETR
jgi:hypothetical protein